MPSSLSSRHFCSSKSVRMCVGCRKRFLQPELLRLAVLDSSVVAFGGAGRSFYFCKECLTSEKVILKALARYKSLTDKPKNLQEIQEIAKEWKK